MFGTLKGKQKQRSSTKVKINGAWIWTLLTLVIFFFYQPKFGSFFLGFYLEILKDVLLQRYTVKLIAILNI